MHLPYFNRKMGFDSLLRVSVDRKNCHVSLQTAFLKREMVHASRQETVFLKNGVLQHNITLFPFEKLLLQRYGTHFPNKKWRCTVACAVLFMVFGETWNGLWRNGAYIGGFPKTSCPGRENGKYLSGTAPSLSLKTGMAYRTY